MSTPRTAYKLDAENPGSNLAGETAVAQAEAFLAFKPYDSAYSSLLLYSDYLSKSNKVVSCPDAKIQPQDLLNSAKSQADYILGKNPKSLSYVVGYGQNYPVHVHHRGASITPISVLQFVQSAWKFFRFSSQAHTGSQTEIRC